MFEEKFGTILKTKVSYDGGSKLFLGKREIKLDFIKVIYRREPSFAETGHIYFSAGLKPQSYTDISQYGFLFTKKQAEKVDELLEMLDIEVKSSSSSLNASSTSAKTKKSSKNQIVCPNCKSSNIDFMGNNKKTFSVGKAVGGAALTGGIGTLAGFAGKKGKTDKWHCKECGNVFDK